MEVLTTDVKLLPFYEIALRSKLTDDPSLVNLPVFQQAARLVRTDKGMRLSSCAR